MRLNCRYWIGIARFLVLALLIMLLVSSGCGGDGSYSGASPAEPNGSSQVQQPDTDSTDDVPTMPAARFGQPTTMIDPTKVAQTESTPEPAEADPEVGRPIYTKLCADCHGEALEGVNGKAEPIDVYELDVAGLTDLLRTGGGYGPEHLFGLDKVSPDGIASLQAFLQTLE